MALPKKLLIIFITASGGIFLLLNSLYIVANVKYWISGSSAYGIEDSSIQTNLFPVVAAKTQAELPDQAVLVIGKLGVRAPIVLGSSPDTNVIYKELERGVVKYFDSPKPGASGVSMILGHSSAYPWYKGQYGSVFALLGHLKAGDTFYVEYSDGQRFNYVVKQSLVFKPFSSDLRLNKIQSNPRPSIVLISCWPVGTNYQRIAVQAELI